MLDIRSEHSKGEVAEQEVENFWSFLAPSMHDHARQGRCFRTRRCGKPFEVEFAQAYKTHCKLDQKRIACIISLSGY